MSQEKAIIVCDECKHEFYLDAVGIHEAIVELNGVPVTLVYFACPKCNKIYRISIQDKRYYDLVEDLEKAKKRIQRNHGSNNQEMARVLNYMVFKKKQRLEEYLDKVNKMFPGTFTFAASENNHKEQTIIYHENHGTGGN